MTQPGAWENPCVPRSNRPRRAGRAVRPPASGGPASAPGRGPGDGVLGGTGEQYRGVDHAVRRISGQAATKTYRCPGCDHEVLPGTPHLVAWPLDGPVAGSGPADDGPDRRHWHTPCWAARGRRSPRR